MKHVLIIRLSSMGDVIMTTPIIRCVKEQIDDVILHFMTSEQYVDILIDNPHLDHIHTFAASTIDFLHSFQFDLIIDLHNGLKSRKITRQLNGSVITTDKKPLGKWLYLLAGINTLRSHHVIDRHFESLFPFKIKNDGIGMELFPREVKPKSNKLEILINLGGSSITKRVPMPLVRELLTEIQSDTYSYTLLGGPDVSEYEDLDFPNTSNLVNKLSISDLISYINDSDIIITGDTAVMHMAAAFQKPQIVLWGSTNREFGFSPYYGHLNADKSIDVEIIELKCRPCSKYGVSQCPQKHMRCLNALTLPMITSALNELIKKNFHRFIPVDKI